MYPFRLNDRLALVTEHRTSSLLEKISRSLDDWVAQRRPREKGFPCNYAET